MGTRNLTVSPVGAGVDLNFHLNHFCYGSNFCSTKFKPDSLSSLLFRHLAQTACGLKGVIVGPEKWTA
jgi:hypothetical protein